MNIAIPGRPDEDRIHVIARVVDADVTIRPGDLRGAIQRAYAERGAVGKIKSSTFEGENEQFVSPNSFELNNAFTKSGIYPSSGASVS